MAAIVAGNGLGLSGSSLGVLGAGGQLGNASFGRGSEGVYVNAATGNLVLRRQDELLIGRGPDIGVLRSYNSQGALSDDNADNWRLGFSRKVFNLVGTVSTAGSTVTRLDEDGAETVYTYDTARSLYVSTSGGGAFDTLKWSSSAERWTWTDGDSRTTESYERKSLGGKLLEVIDRDGNTLTLSYNASGLVSAITSASGEVTYIDYQAGTNNISQLRTINSASATLVRTRYSYDAENRLTQVTTDLTPTDSSDNADAGKLFVTTYTYDGTSKRVASIAQTDGSRLEFTYSQVGSDYRIATVRDVRSPTDIRTTSFAYDTVNKKTTVTDALGQVTELRYGTTNLLGIKSPAVNGVSQEIAFSYDAQGNLLQVTDARGEPTIYGYDSNGNRILERDSEGSTVTRTFSAKNQLLTETRYAVADPDGSGTGQPSQPLTTRYAYDSEGHLRFSISAEGRVCEYTYLAEGQLASKIEYVGNLYNLSSLSSEQGLSEGQLTTWRNAANKALSSRSDYGYDFRGQLSSQTNYAQVDATGAGVAAGAATTQYIYSQDGQLLQVIDPRGVASATVGDFTTTYAYDGLGRQMSALDAAGALTVSSYDDANRKTTITLANGQTTTTVYDAGGNPISVSQGNGLNILGTTTYAYDALGRLRMSADPAGQKRFYLFDEAGRQVGEIDATGALTEYRYNKNNQVSTTVKYSETVNAAVLADAAEDPAAFSLTMALDGLWTNDYTDRVSHNIYDEAGRLVKTIDAEGASTKYFYDGAGRQTQVRRYFNTLSDQQMLDLTALAQTRELVSNDALLNTHADDRIERNFYDSDGILRGKLNGEGYLSEFKYDAAGRLVETIAYATVTDSATWSWGTLAQLRPAANAADIRSYTLYNARNQVNGLVDAEGYLTEWRYDEAGNKTYVARYATKLAYVAGASVGTLRPGANAEDQIVQYAYDARNLLTQETGVDGTTTTYGYDTLGRQISSTRAVNDAAQARATQRSYDAFGRVATETDAMGGVSTYAYDSANRRISSTDALGRRTLFYYDAQGRLTHTINAAGEVITHTFTAFGQITETRSYSNRLSSTTLAALNGGLANEALAAALTAIASDSSDRIDTLYYRRTGLLQDRIDSFGFDKFHLYNAFGDLIWTDEQVDNGGTRRIESSDYDRRGLLSAATTDPAFAGGLLDRTTQYVYDAFGRRTQIIDANAKVWANAYDRLGRIVSTTDPLNTIRLTTYDAHSRVLTQRDALGNTTAYAYDTQARTTTVTTPEGISTQVTRNRHGETLSLRDGRGNTTTYSYDKNGRLTSVTDPAGTQTNNYDAVGNLFERIDAAGTRTVYSFDAANRVLSRSVDPSGLNLRTNYRYDGQGRTAAVQDAKGVWTETSFDRAGRTTGVVVDPGGLNLRTTYTHDGQSTLTVLEGAGTPAAKTTRYTYDLLGRLVEETIDPAGLAITTLYSYDANGNMVAKRSAAGTASEALTRYVYDARNQLAYGIDALGGVERYSYDAAGRLTSSTRYSNAISLKGPGQSITEADVLARVTLNPSADRVTRSAYDSDGRLVFSIDANGGVTERVYDAAGNATKVIVYATTVNVAALASDEAAVRAALSSAAGDRISRTVFDAVNRAIASQDAEGYITAYNYDLNGNRTQSALYAERYTLTDNETPASIATKLPALTATNAVVQRIAYDAAGRIVAETQGFGTPAAATTTYTLDALGQRIEIRDPLNQLTAHQYDAAGRLVRVTDALGHSILTSFDALDRAVKVTDQLGNSGYFYFDAAGRAVLHVDPEGYAVETTYDAAGNTAQIRRYATKIAGAYNEASRPTLTLTAQDQVTQILHDKLGRQTRITDAEGYIETLVFNAFGDKASYTNKLGGTYTYTYDRRGLVLSETLPTDIQTRNTTGASIAVRNSFSYDARGNLIQKIEAQGAVEQRTTNFKYDFLDRQIEQTGDSISVFDPITQAAGTATPTETRAYDARGNLLEVNNNGARTLSYYDALNRKTATLDPVGALIAYSYDAAGNVLTEKRFANAVALPTQAGGTLPAATASNLDRIIYYSYDANGRELSAKIENAVVGHRNATTGAYESGTTDLVTSKVYDHAGNLVREIDARGSSIYRYYDKLGRQIAQVDQENYLVTWDYAGGDNAVRQTKYANKLSLIPGTTTSVSILIGNAGNSADNRITETSYDRMERTTETRVLNVAAGSLNANGDLTSSATATARTVYIYNGLGLVTKQTLYTSASATEVTDKAYDSIGRQTKEEKPTYVDFEGVGVRPTTDLEYDGLNNVKRQIVRGKNNAVETDDRVTVFSYGLSGRLEKQTDATGATTNFDYDLRNQVTRTRIDRKDADNNAFNDATLYQYDAAGREVKRSSLSKAAAASAYTTLETSETRYNVYGEITGKRTNGGGLQAIWQETAEYDKAGRAWKSNSGNGVYKVFLYDANGNSTLTITSAGPDFADLSFDEVMALQGDEVYMTISQFDKRNQLVSTYEPAMNGTRETAALGQFITQQTGQAFSGGAVSIGSVLTPFTSVTHMPAVGGGIGNRQLFGAALDLDSGSSTYTVGKNNVRTYTRYSQGGIDTLNLNLDTRAWGNGNVKIEFTLGALSVFNGFSTTIVLTAEQALNYSYGFNEGVSATGLDDPLTGTRNFGLVVKKVTDQGEITLWSSSRSVSKEETVSLSTFTAKTLVLREQPAATTRMVLQYRPANSGADWKLANPTQMKNNAGSNMAGWFALDWSNEAQWGYGNYEFNYVALGANDEVLNSQTGSFTLSESTASSASQSPRSIGGAGRVFMEAGGKLHITEQGHTATSLKLRYRRPDGAWSAPVIVPRHMIGTDPINGWFIFDAQAAGLAGTYEYMVEAFDGVQAEPVNRASGIFTFATTGSGATGDIGAVAIGGIGNRQLFGAALDLDSGSSTYTVGKNNVRTYTRYSQGGIDTLNLNLDTRAWGNGNVKIEFTLGALSVFNGFSTTIVLTAEQALNYSYGFNEGVSATGLDDPLTGTRNFGLVVKKVTDQGEITLWSSSRSVSKEETVSLSTFTAKTLVLREQPAATTRMVLQYRPANSGADWKLANPTQMKNNAGSNMAGWFALDWSNEAQWGYGNYEFNYVALGANDEVLNSQTGSFTLSESTASSASQSPRSIGGAGRVFMEAGGKLHITEQGHTATSLKLRYRRPDGAWSAPVIVPRHMIGTDPINGWFIFDAQAAGLAGTYEYMVEAFDGVQAEPVNRASGIFTFATTGSGATGDIGAVAIGGIGNRQLFGAALDLDSGSSTYTVGKNNVRTYTRYSQGGIDTLNLNLDTRAWGNGNVKIEFTLGALSVFNGFSTTIVLTAEQALNYSYGFNEGVSATGLDDPLTGTRNFGLVVKKVTDQGEITLWSSSRSVSKEETVSLSTFTAKTLVLREQPAATTRMVLQYRPANSGADWKLANPTQMKNNAGSNMAGWFALDWSNEAQWGYGNYEFNYVALGANDEVLNSQTGSFTLSESTASSASQSPRAIGGAGRVFMEAGGKLHITEQGHTATSLKLRYRRPDGAWSAWVNVPSYMVAADPINGWFVFDPSHPDPSTPSMASLSGTYEFQFEAYDASNVLIKQGQSTFVYDDPLLVSYASNPAIVHFSSQPQNAVRMEVQYRPVGSALNFVSAQASKIGQGSFDWDASTIVLDRYADYRYEYRYKSYDANNVLVNEANGVAQLGAHPLLESHINGYLAPTQVSFNVPHANARQLALYYRTRGSDGGYTAASVLARPNGTDAFVWDASAVVQPGTTAQLDYYYELFDESGNALTTAGESLDDAADDEQVRVYGVINIGQSAADSELQWIVTGINSEDITISRAQSYNAFGEVVQEIDGNGVVTDLRYNTLGRVIEKKDPETTITLANGYQDRVRATTSFTYDLAGRLLAVTDANGNINKQSWLAGTGVGDEGSVLNEYHADGGVRERRYDIYGDLRWEEDEIDRRTQYAYDQAGRVLKVTRPLATVEDEYRYDAVGNRILHINAIEGQERTYYDGLGRVTKTTSAAGYDTAYSYLYKSNILGVGGAQVGGYEKTTSYAYGKSLVERSDFFGHMTWRKDLGDHEYTYGYNDAGWLSAQTSTAGQNLRYDYYANGYMRSLTDNALKTVTAYEYDREGNKTRELYKRQQSDGSWSYDQNAEMFYDESNRLVRVLDPRADIRYEYDAVGNRRRVWSYFHDGLNGKQVTQDYWYAYDSMNRFTITKGTLSGEPGTSAADASSQVVAGDTGVTLAYNRAGERIIAGYKVKNADNTYASFQDLYSYNLNGQLEITKINGVKRSERIEDLLGRVTAYREWSAAGQMTLEQLSTYDADSQVKSQTDKQWLDGALKAHSYTTFTYQNGGAGPLGYSDQLQYAIGGGSNTNVHSSYIYQWWDEAKELQIKADPEGSRWKDGYSNFTYDVNGHLSRVDDPAANQAGMGRSILYETNAQGLILGRTEVAGGTANAAGQVAGGAAVMTHNFYYVDGHRVGDVGNDGNQLVASGKSYAEDLSQYKAGVKLKDQYKNWKPVASADFDQNYQPVNAHYPTLTPGSYTVNTGDTLQSIAAALWGDAAMWYLIADANGLNGTATLVAGQVLSIPNKITNIHNNAGTFKVYNAGETVGDTSPTLPEPPPPKKGGCGALGMILIAIVGIVVTAFTAGLAATFLAPAAINAAAALAGTGIGIMGAGGLALSGGLGLGGLVAAAIGGAVGSIVTQGLGIAFGMQEKFSWSGVAMGALSAGVSAGVGSIIPGGGFLATVGRAVVGNTVTQGLGVALGLQKKFDWKGVAAAGISSAVGWGLNEMIGQAQYGRDTWTNFKSGLPSAVSQVRGDFASGLLRGTVSNFGAGVAGSLATGQKPNWGMIAANSFGSALGDGIVQQIAMNERPLFVPEASSMRESQRGVARASRNSQLDQDMRDLPMALPVAHTTILDDGRDVFSFYIPGTDIPIASLQQQPELVDGFFRADESIDLPAVNTDGTGDIFWSDGFFRPNAAVELPAIDVSGSGDFSGFDNMTGWSVANTWSQQPWVPIRDEVFEPHPIPDADIYYVERDKHNNMRFRSKDTGMMAKSPFRDPTVNSHRSEVEIKMTMFGPNWHSEEYDLVPPDWDTDSAFQGRRLSAASALQIGGVLNEDGIGVKAGLDLRVQELQSFASYTFSDGTTISNSTYSGAYLSAEMHAMGTWKGGIDAGATVGVGYIREATETQLAPRIFRDGWGLFEIESKITYTVTIGAEAQVRYGIKTYETRPGFTLYTGAGASVGLGGRFHAETDIRPSPWLQDKWNQLWK